MSVYTKTMAATVAITGVAESRPAAGAREHSLELLVYETAKAALDDAGIERSDLDGVVLAASDQVDGRAITSMLTSGPAGAYLNEEINVASSPGHALAVAYLQVLSGTHRRLLVSSWGMASENGEGNIQAAERLSAEPFYERDGGMTSMAARAIQAGLHRAGDRGRATEAAAAVAARNHGDRTPEEILASDIVALPLRALEIPAEADGVFSIVVERADREHEGSVELQGVGWCSDSGRVPDRDLVTVPHLVKAREDAFERARISSPRDVDLWEIHDYSPDAEILAYSALGLCGRDEALDLALSGETGPAGSSPVNPGGGSVRGEAPFGGVLAKVLDSVRQVRGDAGATQVAGARRAVAQLSTGFAGQFQSVVVVGRTA